MNDDFVPMPDLARTYRGWRYVIAFNGTIAVVCGVATAWCVLDHSWLWAAINGVGAVANAHNIRMGMRSRDMLEVTMMEMPEYFAVVDGKWRQVRN